MAPTAFPPAPATLIDVMNVGTDVTPAVMPATRLLFFEGRDRVRLRPRPASRPPEMLVTAPTCPDTRAFFSVLFRAAGLDATHYRARSLMRRLPACLRALGARSVTEGSARLAAQPALAGAVLGSVLLGVTEFFRDPEVFRFLENTLLPGLMASVAQPRIWSAACSDGQELYSIAVLLARHGGLPACQLLGTDCRAEALARAARGVFPVNTPGIARWPGLTPDPNGQWQMPAGLRAAIAWKQADVLASTEPGPWHLLLCRNLAIYLEPAAAEALWASLAAVIAPGGYLIVGKADYPGRHLGLRRVADSVYRKASS